MTLRLSIENMDRLPDGGPISYEAKGRGFDLGRDAYLDWTLPDPTRFISGKHCEIRFRDGGYWLHDISTNGTFVNGAQFRLNEPYLLRNGDRLGIGPYIVAVSVEGQAAARSTNAAAPSTGASALAGEDIWSTAGEAPAADDRRAYRPSTTSARPADFFDFAAPMASSGPIPESFSPPPPPPDDDWVRAIAPTAAAKAPVAATPTPRRQAPARAAPSAPALEAPPREPDPAPPASAPSPPPDGAPISEFIARIVAAAGIEARAVAGRDPLVLADEIGAALRITAQNLAQLLHSRAETKTLMRVSGRTMIPRLADNNPLKFMSDAGEALAIMFGPRTRSYLDARASFEQSFADVKAHQLLTFGAMQGALEALFEDLAPDKIDRSVEPERGLGALVSSRKAKLWDIYVERWRAKTKRSDGRLNEAFTALFAEAYDRLQNKGG
jgi:type VI secretion system protein ImpI